MTQLLLIDTAIRLLAAGQLLLIALVVGRERAPGAIRWATVLLLVCIAAYLANVAPALHVRASRIWPVIQLASLSAPLALWVFAHLIFERPIDRRIAGAAALLTLVDWALFLRAYYVTREPPVAADVAQHTLAFVLAAHAIYLALIQRGDDLIEKRRIFRVGFVVLVGLQTFGVVVAEAMYGYWHTNPVLMLLQSGTSLIGVMGFGAVLMSSNSELLFDSAAPPPPRPPLSPAEHVLKLKLDAAMASHVYREAGLSIGVLAAKLGVPEHRLRALVNQRLGYRNFSDFLNSHRIADARAWLGDPARVGLPVLTIAMDLGYGSLAPFNRAFRDATGTTPTDYRRAAILDPEKG
jgi:AraC-like DNA-binding protein